MAEKSNVKVWYDNGWHVSVNGESLEDILTPDGFRLEFKVTAGRPMPVVTLTLFPDVVEADIPEAVVSLVRTQRPDRGYIAGGFNGLSHTVVGSGGQS